MKSNKESKSQAARIARDKMMIATPNRWPCRPLLPMVSTCHPFLSDQFNALLFEVEDLSRPVLYIANLMDLGASVGQTWGDVMSKFPKKQFESIDKMLQEYRVD